MTKFDAKVSISHEGGAARDYTTGTVTDIYVKRRENNYDVAIFNIEDPDFLIFDDYIDTFDTLSISFKKAELSTYTKVFGGTIRQVNPYLNQNGTRNLNIVCKGHGAALEETHCNRDYGTESSTGGSYPEPWNILKNIVSDFTNHRFGTAEHTGYAIDNSLVSDYFEFDVKYINNPYRTNMEVVDIVCNLTSAYSVPLPEAGGHYIIDPDGYFLFAQITDHTAGGSSPESRWPQWWNTDESGSTLTQGVDFTAFNINKKIEEYANHVILLTDFRRPSYDYYTEGTTVALNAIWTAVDATLTGENGAGDYVVGATSLKIAPTEAADPGYAYMDFSASGSLDTSTIGSEKTIPFLNFYCYKPSGLDEDNTTIRLYTTNYNADYFECTFATINTLSGGDPDDEWLHKTIPIGPYYANAETTQKYRWTKNGNADWEDILGICFKVNALTYIMVDDLHFTGKVVRSAISTADITAKSREFQKVLISRNAMDDSCVAADDTGFAARIAAAELFRRLAEPHTVNFTVEGKPSMMAGQKTHLHAGKLPGGAFRFDDNYRMVTVEHNWNMQGFTTSVTATSDFYNSFPTSIPDQYAMWQENMFINSAEAKNIRSGAEVDLLIPMLQVDY